MSEPEQQIETPQAPVEEKSSISINENTAVEPETVTLKAPADKVANSLKTVLSKEAALRKQQGEIKQIRQAEQEVNELRTLAKTDPAEFLRRQGISLDSLREQAEEVDPINEIVAQLEELKAQVQQKELAEEESKKQSELATLQAQVSSWVSDSEDYPFISVIGEDGGTLVFQKMISKFDESGEILSEEEAAREVNAELERLAQSLSKALQKTQQSENKPQTLTNEQSSQSVPSLEKPNSWDEFKRLATERLKFSE